MAVSIPDEWKVKFWGCTKTSKPCAQRKRHTFNERHPTEAAIYHLSGAVAKIVVVLVCDDAFIEALRLKGIAISVNKKEPRKYV